MRIQKVFVLVLAGLLAMGAVGSLNAAQTHPLAEEKDGIRYINGGFGEMERESLNRVADRFNMKMVFTNQKGKYVADVDIEVMDMNGNTVFSHDSAGPWLLADLPHGRYRLTARYMDQRQSRRIAVGPSPQRIVLRWNP